MFPDIYISENKVKQNFSNQVKSAKHWYQSKGDSDDDNYLNLKASKPVLSKKRLKRAADEIRERKAEAVDENEVLCSWKSPKLRLI